MGRPALLALLLALGAGCGAPDLTYADEDAGSLADGASDGADAAPTACADDQACASGRCRSGACVACAAGTVRAATPGGVAFCVGATEVTQGAYAAWLATGPSTSGQRAECASNGDYLPAAGGHGCGGATYTPAATPQSPVACVDWCDAAAYCAAQGQRLCGRVGGGSVAFDGAGTPPWRDASIDQWFAACSLGGANAFPYGGSYSPSVCNAKDENLNASATVSSFGACVAGAGGPHDMSGNVAEWEDSCSGATGASDTCHVRGGSFDSDRQHAACGDQLEDQTRATAAPTLGFRCCQD